MKKSLLVLAALGAFAGVASAQSSVTIYGLLDMSVAKSNGGLTSNPGAPAGSAWTVQQSAGSRLGFRGNEDLGGGLSAQFQIEHRFNPDTGTESNTGTFWQGRSYVQLSSASVGRIYLGRDYSPAFWPAVKSDPFGWDGVGQQGGNMWGRYRNAQGGGTIAGGIPAAGGVRTSNTVGYKSPSLGGLTVQAAVGLSELSGRGRDNGFNVEYGAGPIYAALGYEKVNGGAADKNGVMNVALHYDFGVVKPILYYARAKVANGTQTDKYFSIGALAPVGGGTVKAMYYRLDPQGVNNNQKKFGLGYDYPLSKRTNVYADLGLARSDVVNVTRNTAYAFGVKHTF